MLAAGFAAAAVGGTAAAYEIGKFADHSVKAAASFQQSNTLLTTQAGVAQSRIKSLGDAFLVMASKLGQTPRALSDAFYHVASAGIPAVRQLSTLKAAAQGAAIGNANLEDTTNALVATLRSGVGGVHSARDAMATLMAIVGAGNMRLQDFTAAMGTGLPGAAKTFGVSLQSVGAALSYLTDTGMGAQMASTRLAMALALLAGPSKHSSNVLHSLGLTSDQVKSKFAVVSAGLEKAGVSTSQLASDLRKPDGIVVALRDLKTHMQQAGLSAMTQAAVISAAFGGGHMGKAIMQLTASLPLVAQKFGVINASVSSFGKHWQETTQTAIFQAKSMHGATSAISTAIGEALLPAVQKLAAALVPLVARLAAFVAHHKTLAAVVLGGAFALAVLAAALGTLGLAVMAFEAVSLPIVGIVLAIIAALALLGVGAYELYKHWDQIWTDVKKAFKTAWEFIESTGMAIWNRTVAIAKLVWNDFKGFLGTLWGDIRAAMFNAWGDVEQFFSNLWSSILGGVQSGWGAVVSFFSGLGSKIADAIGDAGGWLLKIGGEIIGGIVAGAEAAWAGITWFASMAGRVQNAVLNGAATAARWLYSIGLDALNGIKDGALAAWGAISWFDSMAGRVQNAVLNGAKDAGRWLYGIGSDALSGISDGAQAAWGAVTSWLGTIGGGAGKIANALLGAAKDATHWLDGIGGDVITGLWNGLKKKWSSVETWLKGKASAIGGFFKHELHIKSPSQVMNDIGVNVMEGLLQGMQSHWDSKIAPWLTQVANAVKTAMSVTSGGGSGSQIAAAITSAASAVGGGSGGRMMALASGGIVTRATAAIVGESGPEAVIPLSQFGGLGGQTVVIDMSGAQFWGPQDVDAFINRFGSRLAQFLLPGAGLNVRRG